MTKARIGHALAFLTALGTAVLPSWLDPTQTWTARVALTLVTALLLGVKTDELRSQRNAILGALAIVGAVVAGIAGKFSGETAVGAIAGNVAAVIAQVRIILPAKLAEVPVASTDEVTKPLSPPSKPAA